MATIYGRKKKPLSAEKLGEILRGSYGVEIREYRDGIALVSDFLNPEKQWWVDARPLFGDSENPTTRELSRKLNEQIPERKQFCGARAI